ncbi:MAG: tetratricopeptide repeat protein, partial [Phycisphaerae bacterium]|nr:tetratricopeptide repeat protein [Phycisphaerae bacterium]
DVGAWLNLAAAAEAAGSYGHAIVATQQALKLSPKDADIWSRLGYLMLKLHRATGKARFLSQAVEAWRRSLELNCDQGELSKMIKTYESVLPATQDRRE